MALLPSTVSTDRQRGPYLSGELVCRGCCKAKKSQQAQDRVSIEPMNSSDLGMLQSV